MRKVISIFAVFILLFTMSACNNESAKQSLLISTSVSDGVPSDSQNDSSCVDTNSSIDKTSNSSASGLNDTVKLLNTTKVVNSEDYLTNVQKPLENTEFIKAFNKFSADFYSISVKNESDKSKNLMVSPLSMFMAFSLLQNGANGATLTELENALGFTKQNANVFAAAIVDKFMNTNYEHSKLNVANSVWVGNNYSSFVNNSYLNDATKYYSAEIYSSDFSSRKTVDAINGWASDNTDGLIKEIVKELDPNQVMALMNALLLESSWIEKFTMTVEKDFLNINGQSVKADYLADKHKVYYKTDKAVAFKQHLCDNFSFFGILPNDDFTEYAENFSAEEYSKLLGGADYTCDVNTFIPKFKFDYSANLNKSLADMGVSTCFNASNADFKGMMDIPGQNVFVSTALQKTYIELDENGVKAAAVTYIANDTTSMPEIRPIITIALNKPFMFVLMDNSTGMPLFIGSVHTLK